MAVGSNSAKIVLLAITMVAAAPLTWANPPDRPSPVEVTLLPRFCWGQFFKRKFSGPQFTISGCGPDMNHYCYGLVHLNRASRDIGNQGRRRIDLLKAKENTLYTLRGMKRYPNCSIRGHVETTLRVINDELQALH